MSTLKARLAGAKRAARALANTPLEVRNAALEAIAQQITQRGGEILKANQGDLAAADDLGAALKDRLALTEARLAGVVSAVRSVCALPDPLAARRELGEGPSGIRVTRRRVPLGVIAIIYEARPNVTAECAALTLKSGNAVILRGGKEARHSNAAFGAAIHAGLASVGLPEDAVVVLADSDRAEVRALLGAVGDVDLVIPRGGKGLMEMVDREAKVPVIRHGEGICHVYIHEDADAAMSEAIAFNAKVHRPGVCNAMETLLVHASRANDVLARLGPRLFEAGVELRADDRARATLSAAGVESKAATDADWSTEFLDLVLAVRTVGSLDEALEHIAEHGTHHTASIVTPSAQTAERFLAEVDASCVLWNASTRFNDGGELGLGAEMGICTSKMHAYGPMGLTELTTEKLVVYGSGQVR